MRVDRFTLQTTFAAALFLLGSSASWCIAAPPTAEELGSRLDTFIEGAFAEDLGPGVAVAVVADGEVVYLAGHGDADREANRAVTPDTVFYIASSTKSFTGLAAAILAIRGELDLDAPLADYLPGAKLHDDVDAAQVTLKTLLTHTHGVDNSGPITFRCAYSGQHTPELLADLLRYHGAQMGGPKFEYGNIGYNIASLALDAHLGIGWKHLLEREIFAPLGMSSTTGFVSSVEPDLLAQPYRVEPEGFRRLPYVKIDDNMHAAGGLVTTARDAARWLKVNLSGGELDGEQVLPAAALELAHRQYADQDASYGVFRRHGYGLGWNIGTYNDEVFIHHFGGFSGFHSHIGFLPEHNIGVAVLVNTGAGGGLATAIARLAYDLMLEKGEPAELAEQSTRRAKLMARSTRRAIAADRARRAARPQQLPRPLEDYTGVFESFALGRAEIRLVDGRLRATMGPLKSAVEVFDAKKNALRVELTGSGSVVYCHFDGPGPAARIETAGTTFERVEQ